MSNTSIIQALSGPALAKFALALLAGLFFMLLRKKETEGILTRYVVLTFLLVIRDVLFILFPLADLFRASDLLVFGFLAFIAIAPGRSLAFWASIAGEVVALVLILSKQILGLGAGFPTEILRYVALAPIIVAALSRLGSEDNAATGRKLIYRYRLVLGAFSLLYLVMGTILGVSSFWFQAIIVPSCYAWLIWFAFSFQASLETELIKAVGYYEESVDSLYELLLPTSQGEAGGGAMQESLDNMVRVVAERTGAEGAAVLLVEEFEEVLSFRAIYGSFAPPFKLPDSLPKAEDKVAAYLRHAHFRLGEGLLGEVAGTGRPLLVADASLDSRVPRNGEEAWLKIASLMAVPLIVKDRIIGILSLERSRGEAFSESDFDRAKLLSNFGSIAIANSFSSLEASERSDIEREASMAEGIQKTLLPAKLAPIGSFTFGALTQTARGVCSDYYDVIQTKADKAVVALGDVAGKGVAAGLVMVMMSAILRLVTASTKDMATLMTWVNRGVAGQVDLDHYATLGLLALDTTTGIVEFSNANQQPLLIYRLEADAVETVDMKSIPIGVEKATAYASKRLRLSAGDILLMYTDGVIEAMNEQGKQYGRKNLAMALRRSRDLPVREIAEAIIGEVQDFSGKTRQHDDETVVVVRAKF
jgi:sigma-B regulation protein RsbU (phosphoserine phosphatase)